MKRLVAMVYYERGSSGYEQNYDEKTSVEEYIKYFENQVRQSCNAQAPIVFYLETTTHNPDGTEVRGERDNRVMDRLYTNEQIMDLYRRG